MQTLPEQPAQGSTPPLSDWMAGLPATLHNVPLCQLAIPGSHDSVTSDLDPGGSFAPDAPGIVSYLPHCLSASVKKVAFRWSVCQNRSLSSQLNAGIRYLDLRVASATEQMREARFVHCLYGARVQVALCEVAEFLSQYPREVVLLDFNHFYAMTEDDHRSLREVIRNVFREKICPHQDAADLTLAKMWAQGQQVIIFYHATFPDCCPLQADHSSADFWPGACIPSPWPDTVSVDKLLHILQRNLARGRSSSKFYVTQGVLTPTTGYLLRHLSGSLKDVLAEKAAEPFINWLVRQCTGAQGINVCIMDFVESSTYVGAVVDMNLRAADQHHISAVD